MKKQKGITLIALIITIIVMLILAGVTIALIIGENGIFATAQNAAVEHEKAGVKEEIAIMLLDYATKRYIEDKALIDYLNEQKDKGELTEVTDNPNGTYSIEKKAMRL